MKNWYPKFPIAKNSFPIAQKRKNNDKKYASSEMFDAVPN